MTTTCPEPTQRDHALRVIDLCERAGALTPAGAERLRQRAIATIPDTPPQTLQEMNLRSIDVGERTGELDPETAELYRRRVLAGEVIDDTFPVDHPEVTERIRREQRRAPVPSNVIRRSGGDVRPRRRSAQQSRRSHRTHAPPDEDPDPVSPGTLGWAIYVARCALWDGGLSSGELFALLHTAGVARRTAERAIGPHGLRVRSTRDRFGGGVVRYLPPAGAFTMRDRVDGVPVTTRSRFGETLPEQMARHRDEKWRVRHVLSQRARYRRVAA